MALTKATYSVIEGAPVNVLDYGAVGDGVADDTAAIQAALAAGAGGVVVFPQPASFYRLGSSLGDIPANTTLQGPGRYSPCLKRGFNGGYMANFLDGVGCQDMTWDGNGGTNTGGIIDVPLSNGNQSVSNCRFINAAGGTPIHFTAAGANGSGSRSFWLNVDAWRVDGATGTNNYAVVHDNPGLIGGSPINFVGFNSAGYCSFDFGACNDFYVTSSTVFDCKFTDNTRGVHVAAGRWAGPAGYVLKGSGDFTGAAVGSLVTFAPNCAYHFTGEMNAGYEDNSGAAGAVGIYNYIVHDFTPTFRAGGVAITIGNGSLYGRWTRNGRVITFTAILTVGSTTTGLASGDISVDAPVPVTSVANQREIICLLVDGSGANYRKGGGVINGSDIFLDRDTTGLVSNTNPITLTAAGALISVSGSYIL
jgi:hypothetical protein